MIRSTSATQLSSLDAAYGGAWSENFSHFSSNAAPKRTRNEEPYGVTFSQVSLPLSPESKGKSRRMAGGLDMGGHAQSQGFHGHAAAPTMHAPSSSAPRVGPGMCIVRARGKEITFPRYGVGRVRVCWASQMGWNVRAPPSTREGARVKKCGAGTLAPTPWKLPTPPHRAPANLFRRAGLPNTT